MAAKRGPAPPSRRGGAERRRQQTDISRPIPKAGCCKIMTSKYVAKQKAKKRKFKRRRNQGNDKQRRLIHIEAIRKQNNICNPKSRSKMLTDAE